MEEKQKLHEWQITAAVISTQTGKNNLSSSWKSPAFKAGQIIQEQ